MNIMHNIIGRDGCSGYRALSPLKKIEKLFGDKHQTQIVKSGDDGMRTLEMIKGADVLMFRQANIDSFNYLKNQTDIDVSKKLFVVDFDDDIFDISPFSESYVWSGLEEVKYGDEWLWKDGVKGFDIKRNTQFLNNAVKLAKQADLVLVTTPYLAERMKEITGHDRVEVIPNAIDFNHWKKWQLKKDKEIRIGWAGGCSHYIDWYSIKEPLQEVFKRHKNLKLVIQGEVFNGTVKGLPLEKHDWIDFEGHPYKMASLNLDIALIPLKDTSFNHSKSCIKWYEFSSLGVPCLVSNVLPYTSEINSENAVCYNNSEEFIDGLEKLITDIEFRQKIAQNAYNWVKENRDLDKIAYKYIEIFDKYLKNL